MSSIQNTDYSSTTYQANAGFVPLLAQKLFTLISPSSTDDIIDIGAGDLVFTSSLSKLCSKIHAVDASSQLLEGGRKMYPLEGWPNMTTQVVDCRYFDKQIVEERWEAGWDKVVSNAALHWVLRDPTTRTNVFAGVFAALKPGGRFVAEMGGFGNISEIQTALTAALWHRGVPLEKIREEGNPWYFPSKEAMKGLLEGSGFEVEVLEEEARPTELSDEGDGEGGVMGWMRMFGDRYLGLVAEEEREGVVRDAKELLEDGRRREDGRWVAAYVRLRFVGVKPQ